jgi:hypothetical protein
MANRRSPAVVIGRDLLDFVASQEQNARRRLLMFGIPMLAALFTAAFAQPAPPAPPTAQEGDIVVEGKRVKQEQVRDFIHALTNVPNFGQIGRFHSAVCPGVVGLPEQQARLIAERMRRVAAAGAIRVAPAKCTPNVFLIVAADKHSAIHQLYTQFPAYFGDLTYHQVRDMADAAPPAAAWQVKGRLSADGTELKKVAGAGYYINEGTNSGSRVRAGTMPDFVASVVVVELQAIGGLSVTQVADYAAMRAFADTDPARAAQAGAPTILTILDAAGDQQVPLSLTHWDLGYLKSLYSTSNAYYATYQRGDMEHVLKKELAQPGQPGN